jgi:beta-xylosidase
LWGTGSLLLQKFPGPAFTATTKLTFTALNDGERAGLVVFGHDYASLAIKRRGTELSVVQAIATGASSGAAERETGAVRLRGTTAWLRTRVQAGGRCDFSFSEDGSAFTPVGEAFTARAGRWVGAKIGLFALRGEGGREIGYADVDWLRIE